MRHYEGAAKWVIWCVAVGFFLFQAYTTITIPFPELVQRPLHIGLALVLVFLLYSAGKDKDGRGYRALDIAFALLIVAFSVRLVLTGGYIPVSEILHPKWTDFIFSASSILLVLEATRRTLGLALPIVTVIFLSYAFAGPYIPGIFGHPGISFGEFLAQNYLEMSGIYGMLTGMSTNIVFIFVAFGSIMFATGAGEHLIKLATAIAGRFRGGPAKVAVVGSAFFGTISGSASANVIATGSFTIPMMKQLGYRPEFAGAVEACASTGGMIMPPVMAVVAFIMADFLGIPYNKLIIYAAIPAIFYFVTAFLMVDVEAARTYLTGLPKEKQVRVRDLPKADWLLLVPVLVLIFALVVLWLVAQRAAFWGVVATFVCFALHGLITRRQVDIKRIMLMLGQPALAALPIITSIACINIIMTAVDATGAAIKLSGAFIDLAGGNLLLLLLFTMIASLVLGMGLPAIACYIFLAMIAAPILIQIGVSPLAAHMFIFYYGVLSSITPPVAIAAIVAAAIAKAPPMKVCLEACRIGIAGLIVPFAFVLEPALLLQGTILQAIRGVFFLLLASYALAVASMGFSFRKMGALERITLLISAGLLIYPRLSTYLVGLALFVLVMGREVMLSRRAKKTKTQASQL